MVLKPPPTHTGLPMLDPHEILSIRENKHANYSISIPPERQQEVAEALYVLFTWQASKRRNQILMDIIVSAARAALRDVPFLQEMLERKLTVLIEDQNGNSASG